MRTEHENGLSSLFDKRFEINLKVKLVLGTNSFQSNRSHLRTQRYTNHKHTQNVRPRERWQWHARKWIAKQSNRRTAQQNRRSKTHRFFTRSKGCLVNRTGKPYEPRFRTDMFRLLMSLMMIVMMIVMMMKMMMIPGRF